MLSSEVSTASINKLRDYPHLTMVISLDTASHGIGVSSSIISTKRYTTSPRSKKLQAKKESWMAKRRSILLSTAGLKSVRDYLISLATPTAFQPIHLLSIMDAFSQPLYSHLASEPQAILALSRFASSKQQFDLMAIEREEGKKAVSLDFAFNWTNYQSLSPNDTLKVTFARPRNISSITLALFSDVARPGSVDVPSSIELYSSKGLLANLSNTLFIPNDWNTFYFPEVETEFVSVNMFNKLGVFVGVCELEV